MPPFQEERLAGRALILLRALWQLPRCLLREPTQRGLDKAWLCLRLAFRYTMISPALLFRMYDIAEEAGESESPGVLVECGAWNGGSAALLAVAAMGRRGDRDLWLFDSFEGLPRPGARDPEPVRSNWFRGWNRGSEALVREIWGKLRLPPARLHVRRGWFHETFPLAPIAAISVLHIDCDWYDSVRLCLEAWYDRVRPGGIVIINDYNLYSGANDAVEEFLARRGCKAEIHLMGRAGAWFAKPSRAMRRAERAWAAAPRSVPAARDPSAPRDGGHGPRERPSRRPAWATDSGMDHIL